MTGTEEPEVQALMKLAYSLPITGAASLHEGALVANYPWDGDKDRRQGYSAAPSPDDATFQHLAKSYAQKHTRMEQQTPYPGTAPSKVWFAGRRQDCMSLFHGKNEHLSLLRVTVCAASKHDTKKNWIPAHPRHAVSRQGCPDDVL